MRRLTIAMAVASVCVLGGAWSGAVPGARAASPQPVWTEVPWPFPMDQWGKGKAFACSAADCGTQVTVYIRAKIGFCNCSTGVADDEELDRISDFELVGSRATAQAPGRPITVAWMKGRSRPFDAGGRNGRQDVGALGRFQPALRCDCRDGGRCARAGCRDRARACSNSSTAGRCCNGPRQPSGSSGSLVELADLGQELAA